MCLPRPLLLLFPLALLALGCRSTSEAQLPPGERIGRDFEAKPVLALSEVMDDPQAYFDRTLIVRGRVVAVCQSAGCWMQIADGDVTTMVRWDTGCGGEFAFPKDCAGRQVLVQGSFYPKEVSPEDREHLAEESGGALELPPQVFEINATAVLLPAAPVGGADTR